MAESAGVLIVDDDPGIRDFITQVLEDEGYHVQGAASGMDALTVLLAKPSDTCLILLDLGMPIMDGWEFRRRQMNEPELKSIPVVIITADGRARQKADELKTDGYLEKPISFPVLLNTIQRYCGVHTRMKNESAPEPNGG